MTEVAKKSTSKSVNDVLYSSIDPITSGEEIDSLADAIGYFYKDKIIQVYWGENGGVTKSFDFDISQNLYIQGKVLWGRKHIFALEVEVLTSEKNFSTVVMFNDWNITLISPLDGIDVMALFRGNKLRSIKK